VRGTFEIISEREGPGGWTFEVQEIRHDGSLAGIRLTMSWQDYDLFCPDGSVPPEGVALAVLEVAKELWPEGVPSRIDASSPRRRAADADRRISERVDLRAE
jgi:hypothetical protein